jgi:hypothetical protein
MAIKLADVTDMFGFTDSRAKDPLAPVKPTFSKEGEGDRRVLYVWDTVTRNHMPMKGVSKINRSLVIIGAVVSILLVSMGEFMLIAVVASLIFVKYVLSSTSGRSVSHTLSNHGVDYSGQFYGWNELRLFFFKFDGTSDILCVDTVERLPGRLYFLLKPGDKEKVREIVGQYLTYLKEEPKTFFDKMYDTISSKIDVDE